MSILSGLQWQKGQLRMNKSLVPGSLAKASVQKMHLKKNAKIFCHTNHLVGKNS